MLVKTKYYEEIERLSHEFDTILFSIYQRDTIFLLKDNIDITPYEKNNINSEFVVLYNKGQFRIDNMSNIESAIDKTNMIPTHLKEFYKDMFDIKKGFIPDITRPETKKILVKRINRFLTIHSKVTNYIETIFSKIPTRHYGGSIGTKSRKEFEDIQKDKNISTALHYTLKSIIKNVKGNELKGALYVTTRKYLVRIIADFIDELLQKKSYNIIKAHLLGDGDINITAPKHLKSHKKIIVGLIIKDILTYKLDLDLTMKSEAEKYFENIYRTLKYNHLYEKSKSNNKNLELSIKNFHEISSIDEMLELLKDKLPQLNTKQAPKINFNF